MSRKSLIRRLNRIYPTVFNMELTCLRRSSCYAGRDYCDGKNYAPCPFYDEIGGKI